LARRLGLGSLGLRLTSGLFLLTSRLGLRLHLRLSDGLSLSLLARRLGLCCLGLCCLGLRCLGLRLTSRLFLLARRLGLGLHLRLPGSLSLRGLSLRLLARLGLRRPSAGLGRLGFLRLSGLGLNGRLLLLTGLSLNLRLTRRRLARRQLLGVERSLLFGQGLALLLGLLGGGRAGGLAGLSL